MADIDWEAPYIETISADTAAQYGVYSEDSQARPLRETRRQLATPSQIVGLRPLGKPSPAWSLEVGDEDFTAMTPAQVKAAIEAEPVLPTIRPAMLDEVAHNRSLAEGSLL